MAKKSKKTEVKKEKLKKKSSRSSSPWRGMVLIGFLAMLLYSPSGQYDWTLDDASAIEENTVTKQGFAGIGTHLTKHYRYGYWSTKGTLYRPLSLVMFSIEWAFSPNNPKIHHWVNILMYGLLCALLFLFLSYLTNSQFWALLISVLFVVHPVHVEVVANIKSRDEIMATLFGLAAMITWWRYLKLEKNGMLALSILCYVLALFSKESTITLMAIFPAIAFLFFRPTFSKQWTKSLLFIFPALFYLLARSAILGEVGAGSGDSSPLDNFLFATENQLLRKASAIFILGKYLWVQIFPFELGSDYGYNQIPVTGFGNWKVLLSLVLHLGLVGLIIKYWRSKKIVVFGAFFYLATISIFSNILITIGSSYGERFLFLPSIGLLILLVGGLKLFAEKSGTTIKDFSWNKTTQVPILICLLFGAFFTYQTLNRLPAWKDSFTLYQTDILTAPNSSKLNYHYALECSKKARDTKDQNVKQKFNTLAQKHFEKAIAIYPNYADALSQLGLLYFRAGDPQKAMGMYQKSLQINPGKALVYSNMGIIYFNNKQLDKAEEVYIKALELDPRFVDAYQNLGAVYAIQKSFDKAIDNFQKGLALEPNNKTLNFYMGSALRDSGKPGSEKYFAKSK